MEADVQPELRAREDQGFFHRANIGADAASRLQPSRRARIHGARLVARRRHAGALAGARMPPSVPAPAVAGAGNVLTWRELERRVLRVAAGPERKGRRRKGDVVAVQLPNTPEFLIVHLAIARLGAVMCTVHMPYRGAEIETILAHSGAKLFFTAASAFSELLSAAPLSGEHPAPDARDAFLLLYTSGTTASPKAVPHPYRTLLGNSRMGAHEHGLSAESRVLCAAPLSHLYGLYSLHCAWSVGACTVLLPAFKPEELANAVQQSGRPPSGAGRRISPPAATPGS